MKWIFCPLNSNFNRDNFDCGVPELNDYLKKYARQNQKKGIAKTFVAIPNDGSTIVAGYYSISMSEIQRESLPENYQRRLPRYPVPAMRIGKLAVDKSFQGRGLGEKMLVDALKRAVRFSEDIGIFAVKVDALNEQAKKFYLQYGFMSLQNSKLSLFIPLTRIVQAF